MMGAVGRFLVLLLVTVLLPFVPGCDASDKPATTKEARVVSLAPSTTEAMFAIGAGRLLVGRSNQCDYPKEATELPSVGGFADPNIERILTLRPTLVIGARGPSGPSLEQKIKGHGIATFFPATNSVEGVEAMMLKLGDKLGQRDAAKRAASKLRKRCDAIAAWSRTQKPVTVVMVFDTSPIYVAGPGGFPDELIERAGGRNVITEGSSYPTVGLERLLIADPDVVIDATVVGHGSGTSKLASEPGWSELRAVREGRVRVLTTPAALRPGPRIALGLADVAKAIHGRDPP